MWCNKDVSEEDHTDENSVNATETEQHTFGLRCSDTQPEGQIRTTKVYLLDPQTSCDSLKEEISVLLHI